MLRLFFECWAMFAVYHCVSIAQFLLSSATSRMLAMLNDCSRVKWYVFFFYVRRIIVVASFVL